MVVGDPQLLRYNSNRLWVMIDVAIMKLWPTSSPLMPANMLMLFVQKIANRRRYNLYSRPSSSTFPSKKRRGTGTTTAVPPAYATNRGRVATAGRTNLYLYRILMEAGVRMHCA